MITITGKRHRLCSGVTRRDVLRVGSMGMFGWTMADLLRMQDAAALPGVPPSLFRMMPRSPVPARRMARNLVMVHMGGGPSHVDTWDPKPDAPAEIRGEFKAIGTNVPGIRICEHFPLQAKLMDRFALIRSITNAREEHASSHLVTGYWIQDRDTQGDRPSIGAVLSERRRQPDAVVPAYVSLRGFNRESGLGAAYLGGNNDPLVSGGPGQEDLSLGKVMNLGRFSARRQLLERLDHVRRDVDGSPQVARQDAFVQRALTIVTSTKTRDALDVSKESEATRKRYGAHTTFLAARRLLEAGVNCVALETGGWDTHSDNFSSLKNQLLPQTDQALTALVQDLCDRGMYEETVIVMWGEFGRTPRVNGTAGRDHWPRVMSALVAGGGMRMGQVIGATDPTASTAVDREVTPRDVLATIYRALGIDASLTFIDGQSRPVPLLHDGTPIHELL